jgi:hypothetical protein
VQCGMALNTANVLASEWALQWTTCEEEYVMERWVEAGQRRCCSDWLRM